MTLRKATPDDARRLAEVHVASWRAAYRGLMPDSLLDGLSVERRAERWLALLATPDPPGAETWVADEGGALRGFVSVGPSRDPDAPASEAEVYAIYLAPEAMGRGVGRALFEHARTLARERGYGSLTLWVLDANARARRFYERAGLGDDGGRKVDTLQGAELPHVRYRGVIA